MGFRKRLYWREVAFLRFQSPLPLKPALEKVAVMDSVKPEARPVCAELSFHVAAG